jgi:hypothetical protein
MTFSRERTKTRMTKRLLGLSLLTGILLLAGAASAEPKRVGVVKFTGPGEGASRNKVTKAIKAKGFQVVGDKQISKTASSLKLSMDTNDDFRAVARELGIAAFVTGEVSKKRATLAVRGGTDGAVSAEASWSAPNPRKVAASIDKTFWKRLGSAIERGKAPSGAKKAVVAEEEAAPEEPAAAGDDDDDKPAEKRPPTRVAAADDEKKPDGDDDATTARRKKPEPEPDDDDGGATGGALPALDVTAGPQLYLRTLAYNENKYRDVAPYELPTGAPVVAAKIDFFPAALSGGGFISNIGVTANVEYLVPVVKTTSENTTFTTYGLAWWAGAKVRFPLGFGLLHGSVSYGSQIYKLVASSGSAASPIPSVNYVSVRPAVGGRFALTPSISLMVEAAYLHLLGMGQMKDVYFPRATGRGFEAAAMGGYRLTSSIEARVGVNLRVYALAMNSARADADGPPPPAVAGGAVDRFIMAWAALAVTFGGGGGGGGGSASSDDEPAPPPKKAKAEGDDDEEKKPSGDDDE